MPAHRSLKRPHPADPPQKKNIRAIRLHDATLIHGTPMILISRNQVNYPETHLLRCEERCSGTQPLRCPLAVLGWLGSALRPAWENSTQVRCDVRLTSTRHWSPLRWLTRAVHRRSESTAPPVSDGQSGATLRLYRCGRRWGQRRATVVVVLVDGRAGGLCAANKVTAGRWAGRRQRAVEEQRVLGETWWWTVPRSER